MPPPSPVHHSLESDTWHEITYGCLNRILKFSYSTYLFSLGPSVCFGEQLTNIFWQICNVLQSDDKGNVFPSSVRRQQIQVSETGLITLPKHRTEIWFIWKPIGQLAHPLPFSLSAIPNRQNICVFSSPVQTKPSEVAGLQDATLGDLDVKPYTLATDHTGNNIVTQHYMCMHMHTLFEEYLPRNEVSIKGRMHWKSRHIRICLAPNFSEFISTGLKKSFPLQIA